MKNLFKTARVAFLLFATTFILSCDKDSDSTLTIPQDNTITGKAVATPNLSILVQALSKANLTITLQGNGPYTVFAPTNEAFTTFLAANNYANLDAVPVPALTQILLNHVISGKSLSTDLSDNTYVKTLGKGNASTTNTLSMYVAKSASGGVKLNGVSNVSTANIVASNGIIHIVDAVIGLPTIKTHALANSQTFSTLVAALSFNPADNFVATLDTTTGAVVPFTVFAPTNSAFSAFLTELSPPPAAPATLAGIPAATLTKVLKYHVVTGTNAISAGLTDAQSIPTFQGTNVTVQKTTTAGVTTIKIKDTTPNRAACTVVVADVQCSNGVIHALDKVLLPN